MIHYKMKVPYMISSYTNGSENKTDFKYEFLINVFAMTVFYHIIQRWYNIILCIMNVYCIV